MTDKPWTPGPWVLEDDGFGDFAVYGKDDSELAIAAIVNGVFRGYGGEEHTQQANANLIAAAPELADALHLDTSLLDEMYSERVRMHPVQREQVKRLRDHNTALLKRINYPGYGGNDE